MTSKRANFAGLQQRHTSVPETTEAKHGVPLGEGSFQVLLLVASMLAGTTFLLHLVSFRLTTRVMDHWCRPPEAFSNLSADEWRALALPVESDGSRSRCTRREPPDADERATGGRVVPCDAWDFDLERYGNNIVSEWRLVCDRRWLVELAVLTYMAACVVCLPLAGLLADRVGRRVVMHVSLAALLGAGFATSLANSYPLFVALRIVVSTASNALWLVLFSVLYEGRRTSTATAVEGAVCVVCIVMALAAVAVECLPDTFAAGAPGAVYSETRRYTVPTADDMRRSMQESLRPLPKGPSLTLRSSRRSASRDDRLPEQYSVRTRPLY
ncbi:hypothetical protein V5799_030008 [Amblyomma americanum]|uniref:Uncharacterized protein n=1 Tax=Amblyomma americanum TaxID=6943 RepID=A0AAQ4EPE1_AMBAM